MTAAAKQDDAPDKKDAKSKRKELLAKAQRQIQAQSRHSPGEIANAKPGWGYYTIRSDVGETERLFYRQMLDERGFEMCGEGDPEFLPVDGKAEIWRCPPEVVELHAGDRMDFARCEGRWDGQGEHRWGAKQWKAQQSKRRLDQAMG